MIVIKYKYSEGLEFIIQNLSKVSNIKKYDKEGSLVKGNKLTVGEQVTLRYSHCSDKLPYELICVDGLVSDFLTEKDIDIMMNKITE